MAERNFEDKARELREARDIYREGEVWEGEGGAIGIVPGAPGVRRAGGRRIGDELREQSNVLRGLREEVQELRKVVLLLRGGLVEVSEGFKEFGKGFSQLGREFQEFRRSFGQVVGEFRKFQREFSQVSKGLGEGFGKLLEWVSGLGKSSEQLVKEYRLGVRNLLKVSNKLGKEYEWIYEKMREGESEVAYLLRKSRMALRERVKEVEEGYGRVVRRGSGRRDYVRLGYGKGRGYGGGYGFRDVLAKEEMRKQLDVREWLKGMVRGSVVGLVFGDRGGGRFGRGAGELVGDIRNVLLAHLGPIGTFIGEWLGSVYERWQERRELRKRLEEERRVELETMGVRRVRRIERERGGVFSGFIDWAKEVIWGRRVGGVVLSAVGGGAGPGVVGRVVGGWARGRQVDRVSLSDVELVQERGAKIYAERLYIEAGGIGGLGGGILDMLSGRGLFERLRGVGRWIGRRVGLIGLGLGAGLAFWGGLKEGGWVQGLVGGGGALLGGLGGAKLGALIGTVVAPGVGTAVGAVLGGLVGMFGGEKIAEAVYSGMKRLIQEREWVKSLRAGFMSALDRIGQFLKGLVEGVKSSVRAVGRGVKEVSERVLDAAKWLGEALGVVARKAEAGTIDMVKAAGVVGHVRGDPGGMSVGMYQFTRESALKFLREYGYMKEFEGVEFGTPEWKRRWQEVARKYGEAFAKAQQEFAVKEYFVPAVRVAERFGLDVSRSRALQEMVFARVIQHGVGGFERVLQNVFRGMTVEQVRALSTEEVIARVYDHLIANVDRYWARSSPQVREAVRKRLMKEKELLLAIERQKVEVKRQASLQAGVTRELRDLQSAVRERVEEGHGGGRTVVPLQEDRTGQVGVERLVGRRQEAIEFVPFQVGGISQVIDRRLVSERQEFGRFVSFQRSGVDQSGIEGLVMRQQEVMRLMPLQAVGAGQLIDEGLVREQREVVRRLIEEGVRREAEWMGNVMTLVENLKGRLGEVESPRKVIMSGGDAFSKVPLFPEDVKLVMMMLGLV